MNSSPFAQIVAAILIGTLSATAQFVVTNTGNSGSGSLRQAIADSETDPADNTITFAPALSGQTIQLTSPINILKQRVTVDASALPDGIIIQPLGSTLLFVLPYVPGFPSPTGSANSISFRSVKLDGGEVSGGGAVNCARTNIVMMKNCSVIGFKGTAIQTAGTLSIESCEFLSNSGEDSGGAIAYFQNDQSSIFVSESTFVGNASTGMGGAISCEGTAAINAVDAKTVARCTFLGNEAHVGGALGTLGYNMIISQCTFAGNSATNSGGAIYSNYFFGDPSGFLMSHCTISGNEAGARGGGVFVAAEGVNFTNSIIAGNTSAGPGGDIFFDGAPSSIQTSGVIAQSYASSDFDPPSAPPPLINADPKLGPLVSHGGPTQTMALKAGSPARNASVGSTITRDQRGFLVIGKPDIGAYEALAGGQSNYYTWRFEASATALDFTTDSDGDGAVNLLEYAFRRDPLVSDAPLSPAMIRAGDSVQFTFRYRPNVTDLKYFVSRSSNLKDPTAWVEVYRYDTRTGVSVENGVAGDENAETEIITITDSVASGAQFYRIRVEGFVQFP